MLFVGDVIDTVGGLVSEYGYPSLYINSGYPYMNGFALPKLTACIPDSAKDSVIIIRVKVNTLLFI